MQFNKNKDIVTVNSSSLAFTIWKCNSDLNRVRIELDHNTSNRVFILENYTEAEIEAYREFKKAVRNGKALLVDIIEFNHIYSCLKQMVTDFKYNN